jgi:integrase
MARKRRNGEGSWGKKTIKGVVYHYYRDAEGHYTYGKEEKEVKAKLKAKEDKKHTIKVDNRLTLGEYIKNWLYNKKFKETGLTLESTTFDGYEASLKIRFFKHKIANMQLAAIDKNALVNYLKDLSTTYSRGSIQKTWQVIKMALTDDEFELYDKVPEIKFEKIKIPTESIVAVKKKEHDFTSNEDMDALYSEALKKTSTGRYYYGTAARLLAFIMYSGLRVGEAIGLKWKDVDLEQGLVTISQTYSMTHERDEFGNSLGWKYIEKAPKSKASAATIPCRERGIKILKMMDEKYPRHKKNDVVFLSENNTPLTKRHALHTLKRMLTATNLTEKGYTVHDLRHGYGSILYQEGVDIYTISKLLRHSDIQTTANIYVKTKADTLKNVLDKIDKKDD